jgi:hypothetical protein
MPWDAVQHILLDFLQIPMLALERRWRDTFHQLKVRSPPPTCGYISTMEMACKALMRTKATVHMDVDAIHQGICQFAVMIFHAAMRAESKRYTARP